MIGYFESQARLPIGLQLIGLALSSLIGCRLRAGKPDDSCPQILFFDILLYVERYNLREIENTCAEKNNNIMWMYEYKLVDISVGSRQWSQ